jgi:hypothetical protein
MIHFLTKRSILKIFSKKFDIDKEKSIKTLMSTNGHLNLDVGGKSVDQKVYHSIISSLPYLCASMPDIMFNIYLCVRFQATHKECHMRVVKRIIRYLVLTPNLDL